MKLSKAEIIAIFVTVIFIALAFISFVMDRDESAAVTISTGGTASLEASASPTSAAPSTTISPIALVNINTATVQELCALPGIGEELSERIVAYRGEHGTFKSTDEIMSVSGIGAKKYENLKSYITVD